MIERVYLNERFFPRPDLENVVISVNVSDARKDFGAIATNLIPNKALSDPGQCFPLYIYEESTAEDLFSSAQDSVGGYTQKSGITERTLREYRSAYGNSLNELDIFNYVYGVLNSPAYQSVYKQDLSKSMPGIPKLSDFGTYRDVGAELMALHLNYDSLESFGVSDRELEVFSDKAEIEIRYVGTIKGAFPTRISLGDGIEISDIPEEAFLYKLYGKTPMDWLLDRYQKRQDESSGLINDPNGWGVGYAQRLMAQLINMSLLTDQALRKLPKTLS